ncbi:saccharopine dehydrogenase NADP-binding domain-containing protein [Streptomyces sp. Li-HN-5-11]|uniref:saccharopine dehydrogenase NADP-binding domain-containing protein n=1 Tax=Streptomyces sp. Li-HN-5-11 TaxID=3075432 RepID=UPI0028A7F7CF|nr:saccharopine dehydrogenase NADP-binding domain-containing protein [Streptomyces sp. Li-HN-5-11]WNM36139.1 saccharopine dehydrogenase NADP-binding domain-containing protein [Streptomyces sp. Li-HN-5-11]
MTHGMPDARTGEVWILGATGRIGAAVAARLASREVPLALIGRNRDRLDKEQARLGQGDRVKVVVADTAEKIAEEIAQQRPAVVVNTIGEYAETALLMARACMPGGHYLDLAADPAATFGLLGLHDEAAAAGSTLVTGAGFGVLATEAVVATLCADRPTPSHVRVDALASVATEPGVLGAALAASIVDVLTVGGLRYQDGRLARTRLGADVQHLTLPDGQKVTSAGAPSGELIAAQRASGAPNVTVTSALAPTGTAVRAILPLAGKLLSVPALRRFAVRRLAGIRLKAAPRPRRHSWGHAVITWPDGTGREGWLRADDGMDYTVGAAAETAARLARGEGKPGAYTPAAALGPDLATAAGGTFILR